MGDTGRLCSSACPDHRLLSKLENGGRVTRRRVPGPALILPSIPARPDRAPRRRCADAECLDRGETHRHGHDAPFRGGGVGGGDRSHDLFCPGSRWSGRVRGRRRQRQRRVWPGVPPLPSPQLYGAHAEEDSPRVVGRDESVKHSPHAGVVGPRLGSQT